MRASTQPTALVHEAYVRLGGKPRPPARRLEGDRLAWDNPRQASGTLVG